MPGGKVWKIMCFFSAPKVPKPPKPEPIPPAPTRDNPASLREAEEQRRRMRLRQGSLSTQLTAPLGDSGYGGSISSQNLGSYTKLGGK